MDISVSGLNGRLASKLPPELPLGLVFVVGQVDRVIDDGFVLTEGSHRLHCRIKGNGEIHLQDEVRASGHLMFDAQKLQYYLLARDVEVVTAEPLGASGSSREVLAESEGLLSALSAVKARADVAPPSDEGMPVWVKKLAPPEIQAEGAGSATLAEGQLPAARTELDDELLSVLSQAMDSEEEVELTPQLLAKYIPAEPTLAEDTAVTTKSSAKPAEEEPLADLATSYRPVNRQDTDWLVILLIISFFVLTVAAVVTIVLLLVG